MYKSKYYTEKVKELVSTYTKKQLPAELNVLCLKAYQEGYRDALRYVIQKLGDGERRE
jgi:hypothetical protein